MAFRRLFAVLGGGFLASVGGRKINPSLPWKQHRFCASFKEKIAPKTFSKKGLAAPYIVVIVASTPY
jgi:hypothetical protein